MKKKKHQEANRERKDRHISWRQKCLLICKNFQMFKCLFFVDLSYGKVVFNNSKLFGLNLAPKVYFFRTLI